MAHIYRKRMTAEIKGDFVIFMIGMRINAFWKVHKWIPVFLAMPKMLRELSIKEDAGLLGFRSHWSGRFFEITQYWRSFDELHAYARNKNAEHLPAWMKFNQRIAHNGSVGIWHETYLVKEKQYETVYRNMPSFGLGHASRLIPATGHQKTAAGRLGQKINECYHTHKTKT